MKIEVRLFAVFRKGRWKSKEIILDEGVVCIRDILDWLDIHPDELGIALVNGKFSTIDTILKDQDVLALFPPIGGG